MVEREVRKAGVLAGEIAAILHESGLSVEQHPKKLQVFIASAAQPKREATRLRLKFTREGWKHKATTGRDEQGNPFAFVRLTKPIIQGRGPKTHKDAQIELIPRRSGVNIHLATLGWFRRNATEPLRSQNLAKLVREKLENR